MNVVSPQDMMGQMQMAMSARGGKKPKRTINTRHILFIVSGAFDTLGEDIAKRMNRGVIGFSEHSDGANPDEEPSEFLKFAQTSDFIKYGFEAEFIGRLPVRVACESLKADDLANILVSSEGSICDNTNRTSADTESTSPSQRRQSRLSQSSPTRKNRRERPHDRPRKDSARL